ncbi:TonB-dependent receptor [Novosphingobium sp.]|uniref:TonB-dependent receptor domain-containing protein n=1 Tax=Novosphingobium sp. TaxID=1874826 RepID=UPI002602FB21|nr:TonB-dependent receptor [Novosphingobium sp.]
MIISRVAMTVALAAVPFALTTAGRAEEAELNPQTIVVTAPRITSTQTTQEDGETLATGPDGAAFIARQPGAALIDNGALSGQVQLRGLFGERILLRINGQRFASGGPNAMDPVMHYAPAALIDRVEIARGISPVRDGPGLGGGINTVLKHVTFGDGPELAPQADLTAQYRSVDDSVAAGGMIGLASESLRLGLIASKEKGDDTRFPGGRIASTSFDRAVYGVQAGFKTGSSELSFEYRRQETGRSGNPPFAMDIVYFHTDFVRLGFEGDLASDVRLEAHANFAGVSHRMNNFSLRPAPAVAMQRQSDTYADTFTADVALRFGSAEQNLRIGADFELGDRGYVLYNPAVPAFFIHPLDRARAESFGGFAEWRAGFGAIEAELGARVDRHSASTAAPRTGPGVPAGPTNLALAFGRADRAWEGTTWDASLRLWAQSGTLTPRLTLARKTRVPSLIERFSWLPTEASGGLADGNIYVGDVNLKPETALIAEAGVDWQGETAYARPVVYYRRIDDFIQGVPFDSTPGVINSPVEMVSAANGDATPLRFANADAEIWGADVAFGARLAGPLRVDGVASWVQGKRRDLADNLYRMAPANGRIALTWEAPSWSVSAEAQGTAAQNRVSASNSEVRTPGYVLASLYGHWIVREGLRVDAGVENLFDKRYVEHLAGYNRITGSDVAPGARLPGAGRSAFVRLRWAFD